MIIDLSFGSNSVFKVKYDTQTNKLVSDKTLIVEEELVRNLSDMNTLFQGLDGVFTDEPLYYMINGVCYPEHQRLFNEFDLKYEYTALLPKTIGGEYLKAHGHIHYAKNYPHKSIMEIMEVLHGKGYFLLFLPGETGYRVALVETKAGDRFIIPKQFYHLTINIGDEPFIFSDIISVMSAGDYSLLKEKQGAPLLVYRDKGKGIRYEWNKNYPPIESITLCDVNTLPYEQAFTLDRPLYDSFILNPDKFKILAKPY